MRSKFSFQQFEEVLQKLAHKAAIEAVTNLNKGRITIKTFSSTRFSEVSVGKETFRFYSIHASYTDTGDGKMNSYFGFDVEEKLYLSSNHCTKISFHSTEHYIENRTYEPGVDEVDHKKTDAEKKRRQKKVMAFIDKMMADAGVSIEPRFQLAQMTQ